MLRKSLKPRHAYLWLLEPESHEYVLAAGLGLPPDAETLSEARVLAWLAARSGAPDLTPEELQAAQELSRWLGRQDLTWIEPVIASGRPVGLLTMASRPEGQAWDAGDRWLMARILRETGLALNQIELNRTERARRSRLDNLTQRYKDAQQRAVTDGLTGLATHIFFKEQLAQRFHEAKRHVAPLSLLLLDIDHFKKINDTFGHPAGDEVLRRVSKAVKDVARACDTVARYGGEELALVLPQTDLVGATTVGERIREAIAALNIHDGRGRKIPMVTASLGVATLEVQDATADDLIARVDAALYLAKREGRNQVRQAS
jgi:diguanylate cyclase (GGDEF)-like protein